MRWSVARIKSAPAPLSAPSAVCSVPSAKRCVSPLLPGFGGLKPRPLTRTGLFSVPSRRFRPVSGEFRRRQPQDIAYRDQNLQYTRGRSRGPNAISLFAGGNDVAAPPLAAGCANQLLIRGPRGLGRGNRQVSADERYPHPERVHPRHRQVADPEQREGVDGPSCSQGRSLDTQVVRLLRPADADSRLAAGGQRHGRDGRADLRPGRARGDRADQARHVHRLDRHRHHGAAPRCGRHGDQLRPRPVDPVRPPAAARIIPPPEFLVIPCLLRASAHGRRCSRHAGPKQCAPGAGSSNVKLTGRYVL